MNISMKVAALTLATLALTGSTPTRAWNYDNAPKYVAGGLFLASMGKYFSTKPNNDPVRYDLCELANFENVLHNLKYLIIDGLIGHNKEDAKIAVDKDMYVVVDETKKAPAKGLYGNIHAYYLKPILKTLGFILVLRKTVEEIDKGINAWQTFQISQAIPTGKVPEGGAHTRKRAQAPASEVVVAGA
jgi:hypothetical protein